MVGACGPFLILPAALKRWLPLRRQGLCSQLAHFRATSDCAPVLSGGDPPGGRGCVATLPNCGPPLVLPAALKRWDPPGSRGYVATLPTCGPFLILPAALKRRGPPRWQGLCSHFAHLWDTCDPAPSSEAVGTP